MPADATRVVGIAGSLRTGSYNRALLAACVELTPSGLTIEPFDLRDVPLYDRDVEDAGFPEAVVALRSAIATAEALLIVTPEYNAGVPAVTKNAVDWASRRPAPTPLDGKPTLILGATPGRLGTTRAQEQLRGSLAHAGAIVLPRPQVFVAGAGTKLVDGVLVDEETRERVVTALATFAAFVARLGPKPTP
ncbi:MAG: NAD(P)H-dependent oxidoreductase [Actinobacteria bacterium]|nr:NAD(P)H-dependent oxidoreductase [Actinomycetota bacterium]